MQRPIAKPIATEIVSRVLSESVLSLGQAIAELDKATGVRPHKSTLVRWIVRGAHGVRLDGCRIGRNWVTSSEALNRFIVARTQSAF